MLLVCFVQCCVDSTVQKEAKIEDEQPIENQVQGEDENKRVAAGSGIAAIRNRKMLNVQPETEVQIPSKEEIQRKRQFLEAQKQKQQEHLLKLVEQRKKKEQERLEQEQKAERKKEKVREAARQRQKVAEEQAAIAAEQRRKEQELKEKEEQIALASKPKVDVSGDFFPPFPPRMLMCMHLLLFINSNGFSTCKGKGI